MSRHRYGPHPAQFGELTRPEGTSRGTVVIVHGGFWRARYDLSLGRPLAADLAARGYTVWNLEYRRVGAGGGWPTTFDDLAAGIDLLADLDVDTSGVVAIGHSAGGHLATWAAGRQAPGVALTGVVSRAGVLDLVRCAEEGTGGTAAVDLIGGAPAQCPDAYRLADPTAAIPLPVPVLCVHARGDDIVPFAQSADYVAAAQRAGGDAQLHPVDGDHFTVIDTATPAWQLVLDALPRLLGR